MLVCFHFSFCTMNPSRRSDWFLIIGTVGGLTGSPLDPVRPPLDPVVPEGDVWTAGPPAEALRAAEGEEAAAPPRQTGPGLLRAGGGCYFSVNEGGGGAALLPGSLKVLHSCRSFVRCIKSSSVKGPFRHDKLVM